MAEGEARRTQEETGSTCLGGVFAEPEVDASVQGTTAYFALLKSTLDDHIHVVHLGNITLQKSRSV